MTKLICSLFILLALSFSAIADPGESVSISVCQQDADFNLIDALQGTPETGGVWTDPDGIEVPDGIFSPASDTPGVYTYTIDTGSGPESATVEIAVIGCFGPPPNNDCLSAQFVNPASGVPFSTFGATTDGLPHEGEENCEVNGEAQIENDVWYFYVGGCEGTATFSTVGGTNLDTKIAVYNFNCPPTTADLLACNDNFGAGYQSSVTWDILENGVYLIRLGESPGPGSGNGTFNLIENCGSSEPPPNDACENAQVIAPSPSIIFTTDGATTDGPDHTGDDTCFFWDDPEIANDVWYSYTASCDGLATVSTLGGTNLDTRIAIYLGNCPSDLSNLIDCNDDFQGFGQSQVSWDVEENQEYIIRLGNSPSFGTGSGSFALLEVCGEEPPANNVCENAEVISPAFGIPFSTFNATTNGPSHFGSPVCDFFGGSQIELDVWYEYTAGCDGTAEFSTVDGTFLDTRIAVYAGSCPDNLLNLVACNDDVGGTQSTVEWQILEGETYYLRLGEFPGQNGGSGTFNLIETCDDICVFPVIGYETVCDGLNDFNGFFVNAHVINMGNSGSFTLTSNDDDTEEVNQAGIFTFGPFENNSAASFTVESLASKGCTTTSFVYSDDCYPQNFNFNCFDAEQVITNQYVSYTSEESFTWGEPLDELSCDFDQAYMDLWYVYTATCTGEATWTNCALSEFNTRMVVYENTCENDDLLYLACSQPDDCGSGAATVTFPTFQGSTYVLRLGSAEENESGIGVFIVEQELDLVSAGADTTVVVCENVNGSVVLSQYLTDADPDGVWLDLDNTGGLLGNVLFLSALNVGETYQFGYEVSGACNSDQAVVSIQYEVCDNTNTISGRDLYSLSPNPANGYTRLRVPAAVGNLQISILEVSGRTVYEQSVNAASDWVDLQLPANLSTGLYFVRVNELQRNHQEILKLVIRK